MKKVLCGLVIALMMTGIGYADDFCDRLKSSAKVHVDYAIKEVEKGSFKTSRKMFEWAYYSSNTYKAMCKD